MKDIVLFEFKPRKKKNKNKRKPNAKRKGYWGIFLGRLPWALAIAAILSGVFMVLAQYAVGGEMQSTIEMNASSVSNSINKQLNLYNGEYFEERLVGNAYFMSGNTNYFESYIPVTESTAAGIKDSEGNFLADGTQKGLLRYRKDNTLASPDIYYYCDKSLFDKIEARTDEIARTAATKRTEARYTVTKAYIDNESMTFIPVEADIEIFHYNIRNEYDFDEHEPFTFDVDEEETAGMELITDEITYCWLTGLPEGDPALDIMRNGDAIIYGSSTDGSFATRQVQTVFDPNSGKSYTLTIVTSIDYSGIMLPIYAIGSGVIVILTIIVTLLMSWRTLVVYKSHYAMEDYRREMTNTLAHDLKSPLMAISGCAEIIKNGCDSERAEKYSETIMANVDYMNGMIASVLELAKLEGGRVPVREELDLAALANELTEKYKVELSSRRLSCEVSGSGSVKADKQMLSQAMDNLLSNAVKYTPEGGSIDISVSDKELTVANDSAEELSISPQELWKPFVKGDKARSAEKGTGLGLSIVRTCCDAHGFTTDLDSEEGKFKVTIGFK